MTSSSAEAPDAGPDGAALAPTFTNVYEVVLCGWCIGCHGGGNPVFNVNLESQTDTYKGLYDVKGTGACGNYTLVVPGNAMQSILYRAVAAKEPNGPANLCGLAMPDEPAMLPADLVTLIQEWINDGALDD
jgi:hypothetical protein